MEGDLVAVRVGEGEGAAERSVDGGRGDGNPVGDEGVVHALGIGGVQPHADAQTELGDRVEVDARSGARTANAAGVVSNTTAWGGPACRAKPRCFS